MSEVATAFVSILPSTRGFGRNLDNAISGDMTKAGATSGKKFGAGMSGAMGGLATKMFAPLAAAAAAVGIGKFFTDGIQGASDLAEATSAINVVFGKGSGAVKDFAKGASTALGQTQVQALNAAKTFGTFGKAAGLSGNNLAGFSTEMVTLASDLASFNNTSPEQAIEAIGAALRGESEPIRAYGVLLDDASMRQQALKMGLIKTTKEALTPQQKVLAAQALIMKQTADAQGDFERTSGGLANQQRILGAQFSELKTTLGSALLPVVTKVATVLNDFLGPVIEKAGPWVAKLADGFANLTSGASGAPGALQPLIDGIKSFMDAVGPRIAGVLEAVKGFAAVLLPVLQDVGTKLIGVLGPGIQAIGDVIANKFLPALQAIIPVLAPVAAFLVNVFGNVLAGVLSTVIPIVEGIIGALAGLLDFITAVFTGDWTGAWDAIKAIFSAVWDAMRGAAEGAMNILKAQISAWLTVLGAIWDKAWSLIVTLIKGAWNDIVGEFQTALKTVTGAVSTAADAVVGFFEGMWSAVSGAFAAGIDAILGLLGTIKDKALGALAAAASWLIETGGKIIGGLFHGVDVAFDGIGAVVTDIKTRLVTAMNGARTWLTSVGRAIVDGIWDGIDAGWDWLTGKVGDLASSLLAAAKAALGIASPSKEFAKIGEQIGAGLVVGIDSTQSDVTRSVGRLANVAQGVTMSASGSKLRGRGEHTGGGGVVFTGPVTTTDVDAMAAKIVSRQRDALVLAGVGV